MGAAVNKLIADLMESRISINQQPIVVPVDDFIAALLELTGGSGGVIVTDGTTTVNPATTIDFTAGATVTNGGGGIADVAVAGGESPGGTDTQLQFNNAGAFGGVNISVADNGTSTVSLTATNGEEFKIFGAADIGAGAGAVEILGGNDAGNGAGNLAFQAGASNTTAIKGGDISLGSGSASIGNADGGDINVTIANGAGTGKNGNFIISGLPTSDPGVSGALWNNLGIVTVSP